MDFEFETSKNTEKFTDHEGVVRLLLSGKINKTLLIKTENVEKKSILPRDGQNLPNPVWPITPILKWFIVEFYYLRFYDKNHSCYVTWVNWIVKEKLKFFIISKKNYDTTSGWTKVANTSHNFCGFRT